MLSLVLTNGNQSFDNEDTESINVSDNSHSTN